MVWKAQMEDKTIIDITKIGEELKKDQNGNSSHSWWHNFKNAEMNGLRHELLCRVFVLTWIYKEINQDWQSAIVKPLHKK